MWRNKDLDDLAKKADNGLHGLGRIVEAIGIIDEKGSRQHRTVIILTLIILLFTALSLAFTALAFFGFSQNKDPKTHRTDPKGHTANIENPKISNNEIIKTKSKSN